MRIECRQKAVDFIDLRMRSGKYEPGLRDHQILGFKDEILKITEEHVKCLAVLQSKFKKDTIFNLT